MASSATRWVRWRIKVKAHVLALISVHRSLVDKGLWFAIGALVATCKRRKASSVTRHGRHRTSPALHVTRKTRSRRSRCRTVAPWSTMMRRVFVGGGRVQAEEGQQRYTSRTTPLVTCVTRHAQNAKPTSRCRTVAPWSIPLHHGAPRCDGCYHPETDG